MLFATNSQPHYKPGVFSRHIKPADAGTCQVTSAREEKEGRFSAIAYQRLKGEHVVGEKHGVSLRLGPLVLEGAGEKGKAFSESGVPLALPQTTIHLVLFLPLQPAATGRDKPSR